MSESAFVSLSNLIAALDTVNARTALTGAEVVSIIEVWRDASAPDRRSGVAAVFAHLARSHMDNPTKYAGMTDDEIIKSAMQTDAENHSRIEAAREKQAKRYENYATTNVVSIEGDLAARIILAGKRRRGEIE